jgi:hypothetical protein
MKRDRRGVGFTWRVSPVKPNTRPDEKEEKDSRVELVHASCYRVDAGGTVAALGCQQRTQLSALTAKLGNF